MSENISVQHRLLGKEDLYLDTGNTNAKGTFTSPYGTELVTTAINAKHIPLSAEAAIAIGKTNVSEALISLDGRIGDLEGAESATGATSDLTIEKTSLSSAVIAAISSEVSTWATTSRDMNGHTLTLKLTSSSQTVVAEALLSFSNLHNGTIVVDLGTKTISCNVPTNTSVISFSDCPSVVCKVKNGAVSHTSAQTYGITFRDVACGSVLNVNFYTGSTTGHYAISSIGCQTSVEDCTFDGADVYMGERKTTGDWEADASVMAITGLEGRIDTLEDEVDELEGRLEGQEVYVTESGNWTDSSGNAKMSWVLYSNGLMEVSGKTKLTVHEDYQKWVHLVDLSHTDHSYEDANYTIVLSPVEDSRTALTFNDSGEITGVTVSPNVSGQVSVAKTSTSADKFYIVAQADPGTGSYTQWVGWQTIGNIATEDDNA